ncbi:MAG: PEP-CTERM sorting domain-containing protein [Sedimentisphaerales bacterium]
MQAMWDVTVSAEGSASGSSQYRITGDVIPEPATITLFGLGITALISRRKRS